MQDPVEIRRLARTELSRIVEIDRTERIDLIFEQRGTELVEPRGDWSSSDWDRDGHGSHSVEAQRHTLEHYTDAGGIALIACSSGQLVGIGVIVPHLHPAMAQLAFLHISQASRASGIGSRLCDDLELMARGVSDFEMVVSATPSETRCASTWVAATSPWPSPSRSSSSSSPATCTCTEALSSTSSCAHAAQASKPTLSRPRTAAMRTERQHRRHVATRRACRARHQYVTHGR